jgi:glycosyltransferase involved in cell wall biosynthesis
MSMGRPVISGADVSLYPDPPPIAHARSTDEIAAAARRLLDDSDECLALGRRGRAWVARHFSPPVVAEQLLRLYHEVGFGA